MSQKGKGAAIGIDLGTTYSCAAVWFDRKNRVEVITNEQGNNITPSFVAFNDAEVLVGEGAKNQIARNPTNTVFDVKRLIGCRFRDPQVQKDMESWPFKVVEGPAEKPTVVVELKGEEKRYKPEELSAMVLKKMKVSAEAFIGREIELRNMISGCGCVANKSPILFQTSLSGSFPASVWQPKVRLNITKRAPLFPCVKCEKTDKGENSSEEPSFEKLSVERAPYHSYRDSLSGQVEPASGARASILGQDYLPEGTVGQARAAGAPGPSDASSGAPSYGKNPGSRRKTYKAAGAVSESTEMNTAVEQVVEDDGLFERSEEANEVTDFVVYQPENETDELTGYDLDKKLGRPHPFIDPKVRKPIKEPLTSEELWWNWRKPDKEQWSRWQRKRPDAETVFLKAMAESGQIKLFGEEPTLTETALYRARRHLYKEERLQAEHDRLEKEGPLAYYSEWVEAWKKDTSREAIQKHFEETGEDENTQLIEMFSCQTAREYRVMMGTDYRVSRDPLAMRMKEDQIKQIWGGDPVYPTVNYIQDPDQVIDFRGPDFHEPTPNILAYLQQNGNITSKEEMDRILASEKVEKVKVKTPFSEDEAMAKAVDIGEKEDSDDEGKFEDDENITRNWSVLKTTPELRKSKPKPAKGKGKMTLEEAIADSENLTDFMLDFDKDK
ncbi:hypothetical protein SSX86_007383 [Deinandra increscens subsp. villosa]|uniref:Uncharacterized protein n=1 Tax=Deinandra increscens subsp. villosa TaxID=3103831 RepID=A0AAP0DDE6_9ASTR